MESSRTAEIYEMTPNVSRIIEAILYIVCLAAEAGFSVTQYSVVKTLFLADRQHLNRVGRPITYDNYVAMKHGPVPSLAYDLLKENTNVLREHSIALLPWVRRSASELGKGCFSYEGPVRMVDEDVLSPSDLKHIKYALTVVRALGFRQIRKLTHEDQAYLDAWRDDEDTQQFPMSYALLFDVPNPDAAREIAFLSKHV